MDKENSSMIRNVQQTYAHLLRRQAIRAHSIVETETINPALLLKTCGDPAKIM
jgi:hypothetical protein